MCIYEEFKAMNISMDHHESDLYVPVTSETKKVVDTYKFRSNVTTFICQIDKKPWYDIPFAYTPFWEKAQRRI